MTVAPDKYLAEHNLLEPLKAALEAVQKGTVREALFAAVNPDNRAPRPPILADLARLHQTIRSRKVTSILEFGVGYSTMVMADALCKNKQEYGEYVTNNLRLDDVFVLHSVDADSDFIEHTKSMIPDQLKDLIQFNFSGVTMSTFNGRIVTLYDQLPNVSPDFIYLDAPDQHSPVGDVRGVSTRHPDRVPMSADILGFEHFLLPGTLILLDGRAANARFLNLNLQRDWEYVDNVEEDVRTFELVEQPLGPYNRAQIEFCLGKDWFTKLD